jgi:hypothetical protein
MKTTMRLSLAVAVALLAGCNSNPAPAPVNAGGSFAPHVTFVAPARSGVTRGLAQVSTPQSPREVFIPRIDVPETIEQDAVLHVPAGAPGKYVLPVDAVSSDSYMYLLVATQSQDEMDAALADIVVTSPTGEIINKPPTPPPGVQGAQATKPLPSIRLTGKPAGDYVIQVGPAAAKYELTVKAQQPTSQLTLTAKPSTPELLLGNDAAVDVTLADGQVPVQGAHVVGQLVDPLIHETIDVTFAPVGRGTYRATNLGAAFTQATTPGVWHVFVQADGRGASGQAFSRSAQTGFDFVVPTAQILDSSTMRVVKDASGRTTGFEVDVTVESKATDRYEVSALLTALGSDGQEHPLVRAQTADVIDPGTTKLTLHFDAGYAQLAGLDGDYLVRDLMLYSQGVNAPMQRVVAGNGLRFSGVHVADLAPPVETPPRVFEMQRTGLL